MRKIDKRKNVLIVTTSQDVGASYILQKLRKRKNCKAFRFNTEEFPSKIKISIDQDYRGKTDAVFDLPFQGKLRTSEIFSILYRREGEPILDSSIKKRRISCLLELK